METLTHLDRCDRCPGHAIVKTQMINGFTLLWCNHHFNEALKSPKFQGTILIDNRPKAKSKELVTQ